MLEVGRVCLKTAGREAGKYCVVIKKMDEGFVMITGPKEFTSVKRRRCNINHLEPLVEELKIKSDASDSEVIKAYQSANLTKKLGLGPRKPSKEAKPEKRAETKKKEKPESKKESKHAPKKPEKRKEVKKAPAKPKAEKKAAPKKSAKPKKSPAKKPAKKKK
jgi:large subunit ribosomal protein L14e